MNLVFLFLAIYVVYMFIFFQTTTNFQFRWNEMLTGEMGEVFRHSNDTTYRNKICTMGHIAAGVFAAWLVVCGLFKDFGTQRMPLTWIFLALFTLGGIILNFNVVMYLIPVWIVMVGMRVCATSSINLPPIEV